MIKTLRHMNEQEKKLYYLDYYKLINKGLSKWEAIKIARRTDIFRPYK